MASWRFATPADAHNPARPSLSSRHGACSQFAVHSSRGGSDESTRGARQPRRPVPCLASGLRRRGWRFYETVGGSRPVKAFLDALAPSDAAEVIASMREVAQRGALAARHLTGEIWEVRAEVEGRAFRVLFTPEGRRSQILLALSAFSKKTQKTPARELRLAASRLADWRQRGRRSTRHPRTRRR